MIFPNRGGMNDEMCNIYVMYAVDRRSAELTNNACFRSSPRAISEYMNFIQLRRSYDDDDDNDDDVERYTDSLSEMD